MSKIIFLIQIKISYFIFGGLLLSLGLFSVKPLLDSLIFHQANYEVSPWITLRNKKSLISSSFVGINSNAIAIVDNIGNDNDKNFKISIK